MLATLDGEKISLREIHRFPQRSGRAKTAPLHWDFKALFGQITTGLAKALSAEKNIQSIGIDTWGVDFGLLDGEGNLLENPYHYRDSRTEGMIDKAAQTLPKKEIYFNSGIQFMPFNSLFQLLAYKSKPQILDKVRLAAVYAQSDHVFPHPAKFPPSITIASTSQMVDMNTGRWSQKLIEAFDLPKKILPDIARPGTVAGTLKEQFCKKWKCGPIPVIAVGTHDTCLGRKPLSRLPPAKTGRTSPAAPGA